MFLIPKSQEQRLAAQARKAVEEAGKDAAKAAVDAAKRRKVEIKTYKNGGDFNKDAQKLVKQGWQLEHQMATTQGVGLLGAATFGLMARTQGRITVTWVKPDLAADAHAAALKQKLDELTAQLT